MKQRIKIMKNRQQPTDEEIQGYMNFERLLESRRVAVKRTSILTVAKWSAALLVIATLCLLYVSENSTSITSSQVDQPHEALPKTEALPITDSATTKSGLPQQEGRSLRSDQAEKVKKLPPAEQPSTPPITEERAADNEYSQAEPLEGYDALYHYFSKNLVYPTEALKDSIQGIQTVSFVINEMGKPEQLQIQKSLGDAFEREARRLIQNMPEWKPATMNGKPVPSRISVPLTFQIRSIEK